MSGNRIKRKAVSKKLRFEVFKRDSFSCQYCGRMAPDVVLEVDHINPVSNGGDSDIMNLVTACKDCNRGKGKRILTNKDEIKAQQAQLKELSEKRNQLQMMIEWKKELETLSDMQVDVVEDEFYRSSGHTLTDIGRCKISKLIAKYGMNEVCESMNIYVESYYDSSDDKFTRSFDTVGRICNNRERQKKDPSIYWVNKIAYNVNYKFRHVDKWKVRSLLSGKIKSEEQCNTYLQAVNEADSWANLREFLEGEI